MNAPTVSCISCGVTTARYMFAGCCGMPMCLPCHDAHGYCKRDMTTRPLTDESGYFCDWGGCDEVAAFERETTEHGWLPVCTRHSGFVFLPRSVASDIRNESDAARYIAGEGS